MTIWCTSKDWIQYVPKYHKSTFFSHNKCTLPSYLLENKPTSKMLTLSFNEQQKLHITKLPDKLEQMMSSATIKNMHFCSRHSIFSTLYLVLCRLFTLVLAGVEHNPYAETEVPFPKKHNLFMCNLCADPRTSPKHGQTHSAMAEFISTCPELVNGVWDEESRAGGRDWIESDAEWYFERSWWRSLIVPVHEFAGRSITQVVTFISPDFYQKPFYENVRMPHHIAAFTSSPFSFPLSLSQKLETSCSAEKTVNTYIVQQILEYRKQIFCSYFKGKVSPEFPGDESDICTSASKKPEKFVHVLR